MTRRILVTLAWAAVVGLVAPACSAQDAAAPAPAPAAPSPPAPLTGVAAWERLKGNTIEGKTGGDSFAEYFGTDGGVRYVDKDGKSTGTWTVQKDKVCFDFPEDDDRSCSAFVLDGDSGTATDDDGSVVRFKLAPGNEKGL